MTGTPLHHLCLRRGRACWDIQYGIFLRGFLTGGSNGDIWESGLARLATQAREGHAALHVSALSDLSGPWVTMAAEWGKP